MPFKITEKLAVEAEFGPPISDLRMCCLTVSSKAFFTESGWVSLCDLERGKQQNSQWVKACDYYSSPSSICICLIQNQKLSYSKSLCAVRRQSSVLHEVFLGTDQAQKFELKEHWFFLCLQFLKLVLYSTTFQAKPLPWHRLHWLGKDHQSQACRFFSC